MDLKNRSAFTLVELLVVIGIVGILSSLLLPTLSRAKSLAKRAVCVSNLKQIGMANLLYAEDDRYGYLSPRVNGRDDYTSADLNWLFPDYVSSPDVFICPGTKNLIRTNTHYDYLSRRFVLSDLTYRAPNRGRFVGTSYLFYSFMGKGSVEYSEHPYYGTRKKLYAYKKKTLNNISSHRHHNTSFGLKGRTLSPTDTWLFLDNNSCLGVDNQSSSSAEEPLHAGLFDDYPSSEDNHRELGGNVALADGHVDWVPASDYVYRYELSEDEGRDQVAHVP